MQISSPTKVGVVEINPFEDPRWEAFVVAHPDGTIYHHPAWLKALECEYRQRSVYLACEDSGGTLLGILPLTYTRGLPLSGSHPLIGQRLSSLPRTPVAGPLTVDSGVTAELLNEAVRRATSDHRFRIQIKAHCAELGDGLDGIVRKPWRVSYVVRLAGRSGQTYTIADRQNRSSVKRAVNKGLANGVRTRMAKSEADLRAWYGIYLETMRRNLALARPYRFFSALWELMHSKGLMRVILAEHHTDEGSRMIGGYIFFAFRHTITYAFGASHTKDLSLRPNDVILWQAINEASQEGYQLVDLGEVPEGDDELARFKRKWGADPHRLYRYYYPDFPDAERRIHNGKSVPMRLAAFIWPHMPLAMTAWLGDHIYGYL